MKVVQGRVVTMDHSGTTLKVFENIPDISYSFTRSDKASASWTIPLAHPQLTAMSGATGLAPKRTDYRIGVSDDDGVNWETVNAGICGPVGLSSTKDSISCVGTDWLEWLDQLWRFAGYSLPPDDWDADKVVKTWSTGDTMENIIIDLCEGMYIVDANSVEITVDFTTPGFNDPPFLPVVMVLGQDDNALSKIKEIGTYTDPYGYEFYITHNKVLTIAAPRFYNVTDGTASSVAIHEFKPSENNITSLDWTNNGPKAITTIGKGRGYPGWKGFSTYEPSANIYRDWWQEVDLTPNKSFMSNAAIEAATDSVGTHDRNPQHDLTLTFKPEIGLGNTNPDYKGWFRTQVCSVIHVDSEDWFLPFHRINGWFWIVKQELKNDNVGNWTCTLTLEQIY